MDSYQFRIIHWVLSLIVGFSFVSYSQNVEHLFPDRGWIQYVGVGDLDGKRIVSDIRVVPKDSTSREIHVILEVLTDWKISDHYEVDLVFDPEANVRIDTGEKDVEAFRYRLKDSEVFIDFEKPVSFTYYDQDHELITSWASHWAVINFPKQLKKYQEVLDIYFEK